MKKIVTIFGSSKPVNNEEQYLTASNLGKKLALNGFDICTGGFNGIMEAASKGAVEGGGQASGVTVNLWGVTYRTSSRTLSSKVVLLCPSTCQRPVTPGLISKPRRRRQD